ncbi:MAG: MBL fold metallo-hydrolase, partial [Chloroflexota bacterium]
MAVSMPLSPVDRLDVTILVDNTVNMLLGSAPPAVRRHRLDVERPGLLAEHGMAMLVSVTKGDRSSTFLFDAGLSRDALVHNMDVLEVRAQDIQDIVLSHGHADHCGGLAGVARRWGKRRLPVLLHPDAHLNRKVVLPDGSEVRLPPPDLRSLGAEGIDVIEDRQPSYVVEGLALVTGGVPRTVDVETGFPIHYAQVQGAWQPDPWIHDDQAVVVNVRDKGLVVLTGCGHAGIINILKYARAATGVESVHGVIGGMHLEGGIFEPRIQRTVVTPRRRSRGAWLGRPGLAVAIALLLAGGAASAQRGTFPFHREP